MNLEKSYRERNRDSESVEKREWLPSDREFGFSHIWK